MEEGKIVTDTIFKKAFLYRDTHGLPLDLIIDHFRAKDIGVSLYQYILDAHATGWKLKKIISDVLPFLIEAGLTDNQAKALILATIEHKREKYDPA